jgi:hypothetical protein
VDAEVLEERLHADAEISWSRSIAVQMTGLLPVRWGLRMPARMGAMTLVA